MTFPNPVKSALMALTVVLLHSCEGPYVSPIPDYPVSMNLNLTANYPTFKNSVGQFLVFTKPVKVTDFVGYGGILVCTGVMMDDYGNSQYFAFDLSCPHEALATTRVNPLPDKLGEVQCTECGSVYNAGFGFGEPLSGPSKHPLKRYKVVLQGDVLYIYR
jgi:nitrite reductase/ring-hydroxylating ferredoxin subunit